MGRNPLAPPVSIAHVGPDDWRRWRAIRLRSLADAPEAFSSNLARESSFDEDRWRQRLAGGPRVLAHHDHRDVGLAGAHFGDGVDRPQLYGMWVAPAWRGRGVGARLVTEVLDWVRADGPETLRLWVMEDNQAASSLYARLGFVVDDDPGPAPSNTCERAMVHRFPG